MRLQIYVLFLIEDLLVDIIELLKMLRKQLHVGYVNDDFKTLYLFVFSLLIFTIRNIMNKNLKNIEDDLYQTSKRFDY